MNYGIKFSLDDIRLFYQNLEVQKNENGIDEIGFREKEIANKFVDMASVLWPNWCDNRYKITAQFFADNVSDNAKLKIDNFLNWNTKKYAYFNFNFET